MSQLPEIPASAYTPEMNTLGAIPDITTFEGERVPVSRNPLTPGTRLLQLLPLPGTSSRFATRPAGCAVSRLSGESNWQFIRLLEVWAYEYRIYPGGLSGDTPADSRRIPRYLAHCHHTFSSSEDPHYWRCFLND
ncbi:hypothetical protein JCGZ_11958 [Jatropha curcas]|uniref:Aminotransferase-like plant mobile domain-containing protein n=1 Tax=Jatropha curcas TaxID=180498 RepID=A0A067KQT8_JATCU|nr:hypothetical protein JCGZ_11958 [Jatropha curcas]